MIDRLRMLLQLACLSCYLAADSFAAPPNVVIILGDDQAWTDYGFMGHPVIQTPHLDKLARESAVFRRGYVPSSLCRPSLASLITGRYPHEHTICGNDPPKGTDRREMLAAIRSTPTLPKLLNPLGYQSLQTGKWWEGNYKEGGFTAGMTHGDPTKGGRHGDLGLKIGREGNQAVADFLDKRGTAPVFLWYAPMLPHTPHNPPERWLEKYKAADRPLPVAKYYAMCAWWDEVVGDLLKQLDDRKLTDNTLVVFVTDNGWIQQPDGPGYAPKSKRSPNDGGLRTPILVKWPGHITPQVVDAPVNSIDIFPTILAACGADVPAGLPGVNLLETLKLPANAPPRQLFGEIFDHDVAELKRPAASLQFRWTLAEGRWKLILPADGTAAELYDVLADPHETRNLASEQTDRVKQLTASIDAWWKP